MVDILELIPKGHDSPVGRWYLAGIYQKVYGIENIKTADRKVRKDIEKAVRGGALIANIGNGYFQYKDKSDIPYFESCFRTEDKKGWSILNKNRLSKRIIKRYKNQMDFKDSQEYVQGSIFDFIDRTG